MSAKTTTFKVTPPSYITREKYVIDIWKWKKNSYLTFIDIYSKFAMVEKIGHLNWLEAKRALLKIFNSMGPPKKIKTDQDSGLINISLQEWLRSLNIEIETTTGKTGIADIERLHKSLNEKLRIINTSEDKELQHHEIEQTIFIYNHIINHSTTGQTPYTIFFNKELPSRDVQAEKERRIANLNKNRKEYQIDTRFVSAENSRKRLEKESNPFKKVKVMPQDAGKDHHVVKFRTRLSKKYKSQFKRKRKVILTIFPGTKFPRNKTGKIHHCLVKICLILMLTMQIPISTNQMMQVSKVENEHGYVITEQGKFYQSTNFTNKILTVNRTEIELAYQKLKHEFDENKLLQTNIITRYIKLAEKEKEMFHIRHKRGLFNAIGSSLKFLFGTLDEEDRATMQRALENIQKNQINTEELNSIIQHINEEHKFFNQLRNTINSLQNQFTQKIVSDTFLNTIKSYLEHVQDVQLGLQLARLGIINPKLIDLETASKITSDQFEEIRTSVWKTENILYFVLSVPQEIRTFPKLRIFPLPNSQNFEIKVDPNQEYVLINQTLYKVNNKKKLETESNECIRNILNNINTKCEYAKNTKSGLYYFAPNIIITKNMNKTNCIQNCNNLKLEIAGNNIITFDNCKIQINDFIIEIKKIKDFVNLMPYAKEIKQIEFENIIITDIKLHVDHIESQNGKISIVLIISITLGMLLVVLFFYNSKCKKCKENVSNANTNVP